MIGEQSLNGVLAGLIGFSVVTMVAAIAILMVCLVGWFLSRGILKRALSKVGVKVNGLIFVPLVGDLHMISKLGSTGAFQFFGIAIPAVVPEIFVFVNVIGIVVLPTVLKLFLLFVGWFLNGAVYTRVWDLADGKADGESNLWGLLSAMIPIVFFVKTVMMAFSGQQQVQQVQQVAQAPAKTKPVPVQQKPVHPVQISPAPVQAVKQQPTQVKQSAPQPVLKKQSVLVKQKPESKSKQQSTTFNQGKGEGTKGSIFL